MVRVANSVNVPDTTNDALTNGEHGGRCYAEANETCLSQADVCAFEGGTPV